LDSQRNSCMRYLADTSGVKLKTKCLSHEMPRFIKKLHIFEHACVFTLFHNDVLLILHGPLVIDNHLSTRLWDSVSGDFDFGPQHIVGISKYRLRAKIIMFSYLSTGHSPVHQIRQKSIIKRDPVHSRGSTVCSQGVRALPFRRNYSPQKIIDKDDAV